MFTMKKVQNVLQAVAHMGFPTSPVHSDFEEHHCSHQNSRGPAAAWDQDGYMQTGSHTKLSAMLPVWVCLWEPLVRLSVYMYLCLW